VAKKDCDALVWEFDLNEQGKLLVNGTDMSGLLALGGVAPTAPVEEPAPPPAIDAPAPAPAPQQ
jgi:hypothetical protein